MSLFHFRPGAEGRESGGPAERSSRSGPPPLSIAFDPRANGLNAVRLLLATFVIVWHAVPLSGRTLDSDMLRQLLAEIWVDGFFAASGFLIVGSWLRRPHWGAYLTARILRILPAFYACLLVVSLVLAPLALKLTQGPLPDGFWTSSWSFIANNSLLRINQWDIAGTPMDVPYPGVWNGSLWTLWWEFLCYLAVLGLGVARLLSFRWTISTVFVLALVGEILSTYDFIGNYYIVNGSRFALMFAAGALVYRYQHRIPTSWPLIGGAAALVVLSGVLPDYRILAAFPLAYVVIATGALLRRPAFRLKNDISYGVYIYAFPVQQMLALAGVAQGSFILYVLLSVAGTLPLAVASWFLVEKPAMRLRRFVRGA